MRIIQKRSIGIFILCISCIILASGIDAEALKMPQVFGDEMVLQRDLSLPLWGKGTPGSKIKVTYKSVTVNAVANSNGKWIVEIPPLKADFHGSDLCISSSKDGQLVFHDVVVGEVWLCSGQSNMERPLKYTDNSYMAVKYATQKSLRLFSLKGITWTGKPYTRKKMEELRRGTFFTAKWTDCVPETAKDFSAVAYYFGCELSKKLNVPVGLICNAVGGSPIESWMSKATLASDPQLAPLLQGEWYDRLNYAWCRSSAKVSLSPWFKAVEKAEKSHKITPPCPGHVFQPVFLYDHMLKPLAPFGIRGVLWYQGESNDRDGYAYAKKFKAMISCWRNLWKRNFPFLFVQLPNYGGLSSDGIRRLNYNKKISWALIRESQKSALSIPGTAMAVTIDLGERKNIHPKDKKDVAHRLFLLALNRVYGEKILAEGPIYKSITIKGDKLFVKFDNVGGRVVGKYGYLDGFSIAGEERVFYPAIARLKTKDSIAVFSDKVQHPVAVRYGWTNNPECTLYNCENGKKWPPYLPASPFRTDNWPLETHYYRKSK